MKEQLKNMFTWNNFFTFSGRVTGFQCAIGHLTWGIISVGYYLLTLLFSLAIVGKLECDICNVVTTWKVIAEALPNWAALFWGLAAFILFGLAALSGLSFTVRRLHDLNLSGWWCVSFFIVALISKIPIFNLLFTHDPNQLCYLLFLVWPGMKGENRFGQDPSQGFEAAVSHEIS